MTIKASRNKCGAADVASMMDAIQTSRRSKKLKPRANDVEDPLRRDLIYEAQAHFAAAVVTRNPWPDGWVEDQMVNEAFHEAIKQYASKNEISVEELDINRVLSGDEWKLVS